MTVIYSSERIEGLSGEYRNPAFFAGPIKGVKLVYTDHNPIREAYLSRGVEVKPIKKDTFSEYLEKIEDKALREKLKSAVEAGEVALEETKGGRLTKETKEALQKIIEEYTGENDG